MDESHIVLSVIAYNNKALSHSPNVMLTTHVRTSLDYTWNEQSKRIWRLTFVRLISLSKCYHELFIFQCHYLIEHRNCLLKTVCTQTLSRKTMTLIVLDLTSTSINYRVKDIA